MVLANLAVVYLSNHDVEEQRVVEDFGRVVASADKFWPMQVTYWAVIRRLRAVAASDMIPGLV